MIFSERMDCKAGRRVGFHARDGAIFRRAAALFAFAPFFICPAAAMSVETDLAEPSLALETGANLGADEIGRDVAEPSFTLETSGPIEYSSASNSFQFEGPSQGTLGDYGFSAGKLSVGWEGDLEAGPPVSVWSGPSEGEGAGGLEPTGRKFTLSGERLTYDISRGAGRMEGSRLEYLPPGRAAPLWLDLDAVHILEGGRTFWIPSLREGDLGGAVVQAASVTVRLDRNTAETREPFLLQKAFSEREILTLKGDELEYDFASQTGEIKALRVEYAGLNMAAETARAASETVELTHARLSACPLEGTPDFQVKSRTAILRPGKKLELKRATLFIGKWRILTLKRYSAVLGGLGKEDGPPDSSRRFGIKGPKFGAASGYGLHARTSLWARHKKSAEAELHLDAYARAGGLPMAAVRRPSKGGAWTFKLGRERRENMGYFIQSQPTLTTHSPQIGYAVADKKALNGAAEYGWTLEAGRMRETLFGKPRNRFQARSQARVPFGHAAGGRFRLTAEGRYHAYQYGQDYRVLVQGFGWGRSDGDRTWTDLSAHTVEVRGSTPFQLDLVDPTDKLIAAVSRPVNSHYSAAVHGQYNLDRSVFDELEYFVTRRFQCVEATVSWKSERKEFNGGIRALGIAF